jgi:hypothetical protein
VRYNFCLWRKKSIFVYIMIRIVLLPLFYFITTAVFANTDTVKVPINRIIYHDRINAEQKLVDKLDGKQNNSINLSELTEVNQAVTDIFFRRIDELQDSIELSKKIIGQQQKVKYLAYAEQFVKSYRTAVKAKSLNFMLAPTLFKAFEAAMQANINSSSITPIISANEYEVGRIIIALFSESVDIVAAKKINYLKFVTANPTKILNTLSEYATEPFADSLLNVALKANPIDVYKYASSKTALGTLIQNSSNKYVQKIVGISRLQSALLYFPFLDDLVSGAKTESELFKIIGNGDKGYDSVKYFKTLVKTELAYFKRLQNKDTAMAYLTPSGLREMIKYKANQHFVTIINELHEAKDPVRMRPIDSLTSQELYLMIVLGEADIYTSSYQKSFVRLLQRLGKQPRTDTLMEQMHFIYFKRFIKMAANFNRLDTFLSLMPKSKAALLMHNFVDNLDKTDNLEDAVDVADSYSSIKNTELRANILKYVKENLGQASEANNERGTIIYGILNNILQSADTTAKIDLTALYGIPSIYNIPQTDLADDSGRIIQQVFFYGDDDGKIFYRDFINSFSDKKLWQVVEKKEWAEIKTIKGKPIWIFVNKALDTDKNKDDTAQFNLIKYMADLNLNPTVIVHRGHSYWLDRTLNRMPDDARLIVLGSCGGYKNLSRIIKNSPRSHIISTKEIGVGNINKPILNYINSTLNIGNGIAWQPMWRSLDTLFNKEKSPAIRESWANYIPPYKNLGAIFLKAYNKMLGQ